MRNLISIGAVGILVVIGILVSLPPAIVQSAPLSTGVVPASDLNPYQGLSVVSPTIKHAQSLFLLCLQEND